MAVAPDNSALQVFYGTLPLVGAILLAQWNSNRRLDDLKAALNKRIDDLTSTVSNGFNEVNDRLGRLEGRVSDLEKSTRMIRS